MAKRRLALSRALVAPLGFGAAVAVLAASGGGDLAAPPLDGLGAWLEARGPATASVALLRLAALAAATWLFVSTAAVSAARLLGADTLAARLEAALPRLLRHVLTGLVGVGAAGATVLGGESTTVAASPAATAVGPPIRLAAAPTQQGSTEPTVTMSVLPEAATPPAATQSSEAVVEPSWTVAPGESFWSIAEELMADDLGRPPSDAEVVPRWRALIDANRDRLLTGDPDLIFPGQVFRVPPTA